MGDDMNLFDEWGNYLGNFRKNGSVLESYPWFLIFAIALTIWGFIIFTFIRLTQKGFSAINEKHYLNAVIYLFLPGLLLGISIVFLFSEFIIKNPNSSWNRSSLVSGGVVTLSGSNSGDRWSICPYKAWFTNNSNIDQYAIFRVKLQFSDGSFCETRSEGEGAYETFALPAKSSRTIEGCFSGYGCTNGETILEGKFTILECSLEVSHSISFLYDYNNRKTVLIPCSSK